MAEQRSTGKVPPTPQDDLFDKLDGLMAKRRGRPTRLRAEPTVPTLTEAVSPPPQQLEIPVLNEVVDDTSRERSEDQAPHVAPMVVDKRQQLQVALYLRLRQRIDEELQAAISARMEAAGGVPDVGLSNLARTLRNALPAIVRESVEQVFGPDEEPRKL
jgi:hypothetical protein